jgi:hypothetical protein
MRLLLDTHVFLWFISGDARLVPHQHALRDPANDVFLSVVSTVWLIVGEKVKNSTKKRFSLGSTFTVNEVGQLVDDRFKYYAHGCGKAFDPPLVISNEPWFEEFRKNARSFEGICPIKDEMHIAALKQLASKAGTEDQSNDFNRIAAS